MSGDPWSRSGRLRRRLGRRLRRAAGRVREAMGGRAPSVPPDEDAAYAAELLGSVWAPDAPERLTVGDAEFVVGLVDLTAPENDPAEHLVVFKFPAMVPQYRALATALDVRRVVELGVFWGGSTALLYQLFQPDVLVAFELLEHPRPALERFIEDRGIADRLRVHYGVHQSDQVRMLALLRDAIGDAPLDLVVDDASHSYEHTRASFTALFPLVREEGVYVIEDWEWAHIPGDRWQRDGGYLPGEPALTNLLAEIITLQGTRPDIVREVRVRRELAEIVRGEAPLEAPINPAQLMMNRGNPFRPYI